VERREFEIEFVVLRFARRIIVLGIDKFLEFAIRSAAASVFYRITC
jgi:hypothetical protein